MSNGKPLIWIADDDSSTRLYVAEFLSSCGYGVECFESGAGVISHFGSGRRPALLILDIGMPEVGGLEVLAHMERLGQRTPVIVLSGIGQANTIVKAMRLGATDYLLKPLADDELAMAVEEAVDGQGAAGGCDEATGDSAFPSSNRRMLRIKNICDQVARTDVPVLLLGESGVGKEVLARYIHAQSNGAAPFVRVNCAALPADLLESELFGHERGAFTGALRDKPGKFELAGQGTLLLDEIGEMHPLLQAKLLHVLQDGEYTRVGGVRPSQSQARILASTNRNLKALVAGGSFREDLYFRLNVISIEIPPLRERPEDIGPLCRHFVDRYRVKYRSSIKCLPAELEQAFIRFRWPGNIRQMENAVKRFLILPDLESALSELRESAPPERAAPPESLPLRTVSALASEHAEKEVILLALQEVNWNRKEAARRLNICYKSLLNKIRKWQLDHRKAA